MKLGPIEEIAARLATGGCHMPHPGSKVVSERMLNLSALFGFIGNFAAEGCFKTLAKEVQELERLLHDAKKAVSYNGNGHPLVGRPEWELWLSDFDRLLAGQKPPTFDAPMREALTSLLRMTEDIMRRDLKMAPERIDEHAVIDSAREALK